MLSGDISLLLSIITALTVVGGMITSAYKAKKDANKGIKESEQTTRRDTIADRDAFIDQQQERISSLEERMDLAEKALIYYQNLVSEKNDYIQELRHHIYKGLGPPPPAPLSSTIQP